MSNSFATSDWHLGHDNLVEYEPSRGPVFEQKILRNVSEYILKQKQSCIGYFLGDLLFGIYWAKTVQRLIEESGIDWHFIRGNHDRKLSDKKILGMGFKSVQDYLILETRFGKALLSHYPIINHDPRYLSRVIELNSVFEANKCAVNIHGHTHSFSHPDPRLINVSVEATNYQPMEIS